MSGNPTNDPSYTPTSVNADNAGRAGIPVPPILTPVDDTSLQLEKI